jgi:Na+/melibiose symporter-like transporter
MLYLTAAPLWITGLLLVGLPTFLAMLGPVIIRRHISLDRLQTNNEVAGFKFATVGVLYAVLLAFAVVIVWQKFNDAENNAALEAGAAATIFRLADGIGASEGDAISAATAGYLQSAIEQEWPSMEGERESPATGAALDDVYSVVVQYVPTNARTQELTSEILHQLDLLTQSRRERLVLASGVVPGVLWVVLFAGAFITVGFTFFFGTKNLRAQTLMTAALAVLIFAGLLIIIAIDHPFAGTVRVDPRPLESVLADFRSHTG